MLSLYLLFDNYLNKLDEQFVWFAHRSGLDSYNYYGTLVMPAPTGDVPCCGTLSAVVLWLIRFLKFSGGEGVRGSWEKSSIQAQRGLALIQAKLRTLSSHFSGWGLARAKVNWLLLSLSE